jgi:nitrogen fixation NifU-like protein
MEKGEEGIGMTEKDDLDEIVADIQERLNRKDEKRYSPEVLREFKDPSNLGRISDPDAIASIRGPCGDTMEFSLRIENGRIVDIKFMTDGCGSSIACGSMTTRISKGMKIEDAVSLSEKDILESLGGLPKENKHCAKLAADTFHKALDDLQRKS